MRRDGTHISLCIMDINGMVALRQRTGETKIGQWRDFCRRMWVFKEKAAFGQTSPSLAKRPVWSRAPVERQNVWRGLELEGGGKRRSQTLQQRA
jgi:hypothetical protein